MTYNISKRDLIINPERCFTKKIAGPDFFLRARGRRSIVAQRKKKGLACEPRSLSSHTVYGLYSCCVGCRRRRRRRRALYKRRSILLAKADF
jgi:hypothetical protein